MAHLARQDVMASLTDNAESSARWSTLAATAPMRLRNYYNIPSSPNYAAQMNNSVPQELPYDHMAYASDAVSSEDPNMGAYSPSFYAPQAGFTEPPAPASSTSQLTPQQVRNALLQWQGGGR